MRFRRYDDAALRLFCFHCAGGSASEFRKWPTHLPGSIDLVAIQLPGREGRVSEAFVENVASLIGRVVEAIEPLLDLPYVIFGHSFGALVGFEVIRELRRRGLKQPLLFAPAGRQAPHLRAKKRPISSLPEDEFVKELQTDYGDQIGHVLMSPELREAFVPQIRADFSLSETYRYRSEEALDCPIVAFAGVAEDDLEAEALTAWSIHTKRRFNSRRLPGDHFFIRESQALVIEAITQEVAFARNQYVSGDRALRV